MYKLRVERVRSTSQLSGALLPGEAEDLGSFDGEILEVEELNDLDKYHNVEVVSSDTNPGVTATQSDESTYHCGVNGCSRKVDSPEETCWQHSEDN